MASFNLIHLHVALYQVLSLHVACVKISICENKVGEPNVRLHVTPYTIDLEIFVLGNFRMINFCVENFS